MLDSADILALLVTSDSPGSTCLDEIALASLAEGRAGALDAAGAAAHLAGCARCRTALADIVKALADPDLANAIVSLERAERRRRRLRLAAPVAVAAGLGLLLFPISDVGSPPTHRAPAVEVDGPQPITPSGPSGTVRALRWRGLVGADRYRVTLYAADGAVLFETMVSDTVVGIPESVGLVPGVTYYWSVAGRTGSGRWEVSRPIEFTMPGIR